MKTNRLWQILPGQLWPMDIVQEKAFYSELVHITSKAAKFDRDDVSLLLAALRVGTPLSKVLEIVPGINPGSIRGAYEKLDEARLASLDAWIRIESDLSNTSDKKCMSKMRKVFPLAYEKLNSCIGDEKELKVEMQQIVDSMNRVRELSTSLEAIIKRHNPKDPVAIKIGTELFNPYNPGIYGNSFYTPDRVSSLSPIRVRDLLNDLRSA
jgi:hypothetical protein